jgi:PAS domain S-box-containing protein
MNGYALLPLLGMISNVILGIYILTKDHQRQINRLCALLIFTMAFWAFGEILIFTSPAINRALFWDKVNTFCGAMFGVLVLHFILIFTNNKFIIRKYQLLYLYTPALLVGALALGTGLISSNMVERTPWGYRIVDGVLFIPYSLFTVGYVIASLIICYRYYRRDIPWRIKMQAQLIIIGIMIPLIGAVVTQTVLPALGIIIFPVTTTLSTVMALLFTYAIVRYKLMDISPAMAAPNIISMMADSMILLDPEYRIVSSNKALTKMVGFNAEEISGKSFGIFLPEKCNRALWLEKIGSEENQDLSFRTKSGAMIEVNLSSSLLKDEGGTLIGIVCIARDITERIKREQEREKLLGELQEALTNVKTLKGLVPICSSCKKIRNDGGYWQQVEEYVAEHTEADFSHGLCDECAHKLYPEFFADKKNKENE